jgi:GNAT superfamily N-acetyltransferase
MELAVCASDEDYEAWRSIRLAVVSGERCDSVAELRAQDSSSRLLLALIDGTVVGSGMANRAESADCGFVAPRVLPHYRRRGVGSALLRALAAHCTSLELPAVRAGVDDTGSLTFAERFGFVEVDRQIEQVLSVREQSPLPGLPAGVEVITLAEQPRLWAACLDTFGRQVLADFALYTPLQISLEQWNSAWAGEPMFLALFKGEVIGCAGLHRDPDRPDRGENALTAVRRDWRNRGIASHLKQRTIHWAGAHGIREIYTWTQAGNSSMLRLNDHLGYATGKVSVTVSRSVPL